MAVNSNPIRFLYADGIGSVHVVESDGPNDTDYTLPDEYEGPTTMSILESAVESGNVSISELGNEYGEDNRLFRLVCRVMSDRTWEESVGWFQEHTTSENSLNRAMEVMKEASEAYKKYPEPPKS